MTAIAEALHHEILSSGLKTLLIEPGRFRTNLLGSDRMKAVTSKILDYEEFSVNQVADLAKADRKQDGDPSKLVEIVVDLVRQEGVAEGRVIPFRLPLGRDVYEDIRSKCEETLEILAEWETVITSTDY